MKQQPKLFDDESSRFCFAFVRRRESNFEIQYVIQSRIIETVFPVNSIMGFHLKNIYAEMSLSEQIRGTHGDWKKKKEKWNKIK